MGNFPITWDAGLGVSAALGGDCIYTFLNAPDCVNNVYICFMCFNLQIQCLVSHIRLGIKYCYVLLCVYMLCWICDTLINSYLLT